MSIHATCPSCNKNYQLADTQRGKRVRCKSCSEVFVVPHKPFTPDGDEDEERIQTSPRPTVRAARDEDDEDEERSPLRRRPRRKRSNAVVLPLLIVACIFLGILVLGLGGLAVWALGRSRQLQTAPVVAASNPPATVPQPPGNQGGAPPPQQPMPPQGPLTVELTNANISGFGARMEVKADYRFTSGNPAGKRFFLFIKATKAMGFLQKENYYVAELHNMNIRTQGTISASGMTFGSEEGPFEIWIGEGSPTLPVILSARDLRQISNVVTVESKQFAVPGMPNVPGARPPRMRR